MQPTMNARKFSNVMNPETRAKNFSKSPNGDLIAPFKGAVTTYEHDSRGFNLIPSVKTGKFNIVFSSNGRIYLESGSVENQDMFRLVLRNSANSPFMGDKDANGNVGINIAINTN